MFTFSPVRRVRAQRTAALTALLTGAAAGALALAPPASAAPTSTVFSYTGSQQTFVVPDGVTSVHVVAVGGRGGNTPDVSMSGTRPGGFGAVAVADLDVTVGQQLYVLVGGNGQDGSEGATAAGGFNGGGTGGLGGGYTSEGTIGGAGGGGASDVRTVAPGTAGSLASRLLVAGGGGGAADSGAGGNGGDNGASGVSASCGEASPGAGGTQTSGGAGGTNTRGALPDGQDGQFGSGGNGGVLSIQDAGGGGGGGGLFGGGGGAGGVYCAAGGGGGSSDGPSAALFGTDTSGTPSVTISYTLPPKPQATTTGASDVGVGTYSATLNGVVNPEGFATTAHFDLTFDSPNAQWSTVTGELPVGSGTDQIPVRYTYIGVSPGISFKFRLVATNVNGVTDGGTQTFTTPGGAPHVTTEPASDLGFTTATLNGTVDANGLPTSYHFEYGTGTGTTYGSVAGSGGTSGFGPTPVSIVLTGLDPATTYHFRLVASNLSPDSGADQTFTTLGGPPQATTAPADAIGQTGATLHGVVNPEGLQTVYSFEYGPTASYGATLAGGSLDPGSSQSAVQAPLTGLAPHATYHYRVVAHNALGDTAGDDQTFTTAAAPPTATTAPATRIGQHGATLNGAVNPRGSATTYYFQYGKTTAYGKRTATRSAGAGTTPLNIAAILSGLPRHTTYHFRLVAVNAKGTVRGVDLTFRTG